MIIASTNEPIKSPIKGASRSVTQQRPEERIRNMKLVGATILLTTLVILFGWTVEAKPVPTTSPTTTTTTSPATTSSNNQLWYIPVLPGQPGSSSLCCDNSTQEVMMLKDKVCQLIDIVNTTRSDIKQIKQQYSIGGDDTDENEHSILIDEVRQLKQEINNLKQQNNNCSANGRIDTELLETVKSIADQVKEINNKIDNNTKTLETILKNQERHTNTDVVYQDCEDAYRRGSGMSGVYHILPNGTTCEEPIQVFCDMNTTGKWIVFQRRQDGSVDFYRKWTDYFNGFGDLEGEHWLGLDKISCLTSRGNVLRVDLEDFSGTRKYAQYSIFSVDDASTNYRLTVGGYNGTAGDSLDYHNGMPFTTYDRDNDRWSSNCAEHHKGAWWHNSCYHSNLNGLYLPGQINSRSANWQHFANNHVSLKYIEMKMELQ